MVQTKMAVTGVVKDNQVLKDDFVFWFNESIRKGFLNEVVKKIGGFIYFFIITKYINAIAEQSVGYSKF